MIMASRLLLSNNFYCILQHKNNIKTKMRDHILEDFAPVVQDGIIALCISGVTAVDNTK